MTRIELDNIYIDVCPYCLGVWLDENELRLLVLHFSSGDLDKKFDVWKNIHTNGKSVPGKFWNEGKIHCPNDGLMLMKYYFAGDSGIGIDSCIKCNGFWIDGDEIKALQEYSRPNPSLDRAMTSLIKEQNKSKKELEELAMLPFTIQNMIANPPYAMYVMFQYLVNLIIEELDHEETSAQK